MILRGCFTDDSKEMYQNENARKERVECAKRAEVVAFVHQLCRFVTSPLTYQTIGSLRFGDGNINDNATNQ